MNIKIMATPGKATINTYFYVAGLYLARSGSRSDEPI